MKSRVALAVLAAAILGCDETPFDPATTSLLGNWVLTVDDTIVTVTPVGPTMQPCRYRNIQLAVTENAGILVAEAGTSGTQSCAVGGIFAPPTPFMQNTVMIIARITADSVEMNEEFQPSSLGGRLTSANRMAGNTIVAGWGRSGSWSMTR